MLITKNLVGIVALGLLLFFLICIMVAAIFGGMTAKRSIFVVRCLPALITFLFVWSF